MSKQEFGGHLQNLLNERNWSQADLAREIAAINGKTPKRDAISTYINGHSFPTPASLNLLCRAFGLTREELLPKSQMFPTQDEHPAFEMRAVTGQPGRARVRMDRQMSFEAATEIARILNADDNRVKAG